MSGYKFERGPDIGGIVSFASGSRGEFDKDTDPAGFNLDPDYTGDPVPTRRFIGIRIRLLFDKDRRGIRKS